ncbi:MAG: prepilin peptidase [Micavibrio sp.]|nr:prepilin peptidase [Micavibrio sp.]
MLVSLLLVIVLVTTVLACVSDVMSLRIPNLYSLIVIAAFGLAFVAAPDAFDVWWEYVGAFGLMFAITYIMFLFGAMGGGDSKFGTALALWVGLHGLLAYVFWMAVVGGIVGGLSLYFKKKKPFAAPRPGSWVAQVQEGRNAVPYGIAIGVGGWLALLQTGLITHQLGELFKIIH